VREMGQSAWLSTSCPTLQGTEGRVNAREKGARCTEWISWGNNYSVWRRLKQRVWRSSKWKARRHKTTPMRSNVSYLAACGTTISARENFDSPNVWPNRVTILQDDQKGRPARPQANRNRRRTLWGTLRISMNRERSWRAFSASCR
jgi:hypothetical protein